MPIELEAPFWGFMGAAFALVFSNMGAAYGTGKSGIGISTLGVGQPELIMKSIVPVVMAGVLGIYGLIIAVIISNEVTTVAEKVPSYTTFKAFAHFGGGLACGLSGLAAGMAIGIVGEALVGSRHRPRDWLRLQSPWLPTPFAASCGVRCTQRRGLSVGETLTQASAAQPKLFVGMAREYQRISSRAHYPRLFVGMVRSQQHGSGGGGRSNNSSNSSSSSSNSSSSSSSSRA